MEISDLKYIWYHNSQNMYSSKLILLSVLCFYADYAVAMTEPPKDPMPTKPPGPRQRLEGTFIYLDKSNGHDMQTFCTCSKDPHDSVFSSHFKILPTCSALPSPASGPGCHEYMAILNQLVETSEKLRQEINTVASDSKIVNVSINQVKVTVKQLIKVVEGKINSSGGSSGGGSGSSHVEQHASPITLIIQKLFGYPAGCKLPECGEAQATSTVGPAKISPLN
ncbi:uncharacterized protein LOC126739058 isoform X2 [Anthonomus grandis grandis]|uniref:uncharacterized protein LOC126739058 isoform X2 n=1 Tax=Anthonomus grandis grandis TaxID=2921223 RepID=UPI002166328C|nr:uncharacterized protein LOC126739058 isoform X2 [Anthonomus grandis grandis]